MKIAHMICSRVAMLLLLAAPAWSHHSIAAEFDSSAPVVLQGRVTKLDWMNPHVYLWIDVSDDHGKVTNWTIESAAPNYLQRLGWTKHSLKVGDAVVIRAFVAKGQRAWAKTDSVILPGGRTVTTGRADDAATDRRPRE